MSYDTIPPISEKEALLSTFCSSKTYSPTNYWKLCLEVLVIWLPRHFCIEAFDCRDLILWELSSACSILFSPFSSPSWKKFLTIIKSVQEKQFHLCAALLLDRIQTKCARISSAGFYLLDQRVRAESAQPVMHPVSWHLSHFFTFYLLNREICATHIGPHFLASFSLFSPRSVLETNIFKDYSYSQSRVRAESVQSVEHPTSLHAFHF